jgi:hypothetical protein
MVTTQGVKDQPLTKILPRFMNLGFPINAKTVKEVLEQGHLNWTVSKRPLTTTTVIPEYPEKNGKKSHNPFLLTNQGTTKNRKLRETIEKYIKTNDATLLSEIEALLKETKREMTPLVNHYAIMRDDTNDEFATVGPMYTCLDNNECIGMLEQLMEEAGCIAERAGYFDKGARIWIFARLPETLEIGPDNITQYIRISWSHDMTEKLSAKFFYVDDKNRMVSPKIQGVPNEISFKHTKNSPQRVMEAKAILAGQKKHAEAFEEIGVRMVNHPCNNFRDYMKAIWKDCEVVDCDTKGQEKPSRDKRIVDDLEAEFKSLDLSVAGTLWGAFSVVSNYADFDKTTRTHGKKNAKSDTEVQQMETESKFDAMMNGDIATLKQKAWDVLTKPFLR